VKRLDGTIEPFSASPFSTLVEVMGVESLEHTHVFNNGQPVNKYMSLTHENITDGSILIAVRQTPANKRQRRARFSPESWLELELAAEELESEQDREKARISDVIWSTWELSRNHNRMLRVMQGRQAGLRQERQTDRKPLNLERASAIQVSPLPCCFANEKDRDFAARNL